MKKIDSKKLTAFSVPIIFGLILVITSLIGCSGGTITTDPVSDSPAVTSPTTPATETIPTETYRKADVGVTGKGQYGVTAESPMSIVTVPISSYFAAKEMVVFRMQIPEAMKLYEATNERCPQSHEEFMTNIIQANQIVLPPLKNPNDSYIYDVTTASLMVKRVQ